MINGKYPHPIWRLTQTASGKITDLTQTLEPRLIDLTLTDNRGLEADELSITLSDADGRLAIPSRGVELWLCLGWRGSGMIDKGSYTVDEVEHSGSPDTLSIRARSADFTGDMNEKKERSWHGKRIGEIVDAVAKAHGVKAVVSEALANTRVDHIDQTDESDASFLTRLASNHDAIATVKSGRLMFYAIGTGRTASGLTLERVTLTRAVGDSHRFRIADREAASDVKACWYDPKAGGKLSVTAPVKRPENAQSKAAKKDAESKKKKEKPKVLTLRHVCRNRQDAQCRAQAAADRIARGMAEFSLSLALGRPDLIPELPVTVRGWKPEIDGEDWLITRVSHKLSNSGLTTDLELELGLGLGLEGTTEGG
jgi:phage protein D